MKSPIRWVRESFLAWVDTQDQALAVAGSDPRGWVFASAFVLIVIGVASKAPGASSFFQLRATPALWSYLPVPVLATLGALSRGGRPTYDTRGWILLIVGSMAVQFFVASLVVWSSLPGALVFSLFVLFTAAFHGHVHCVTLSEPLMAFGTVLVSLGALALRPDAAHIHVFSILIPSAVTLEILAGSIEKGRRQAVAETARLRAAVAAQILDRQDEEVRRLSQKLVDLLAYNHDVNNALMSARLAAEGLSTLLETGGVPASRDLTILAADLGSSLNQVDGLLRQAREAGTMKAASTAEGVELLPVMFEVASQIGARFPAIRITVPATLPRQRVGVRGGALSLHRILHNLALNACEGNGRDRARNVLLTFERNSTGASVDIRVIDDGPGFSADTLGRPIEGFETSKLHGTGLGLYTSERLVRASGGTLTRANQPEGGAVVCVTLPVEAA